MTKTDKPDVVNMSLGGGSTEAYALQSVAVNNVMLDPAMKDIVFVIASGNSGTAPYTVTSPATAAAAITVGNAVEPGVTGIFGATNPAYNVDLTNVAFNFFYGHYGDTWSFAGGKYVYSYDGLTRNANGNYELLKMPNVSNANRFKDISIGAGTAADFDELVRFYGGRERVEGKIAVISRGELFKDTMARAKALGLGGLILLNDADGVAIEDRGSPLDGDSLPIFWLTYEDGKKFVKIFDADTPSMTWELWFTGETPAAPTRLNDTSSSGPVGNMYGNGYEIKPDILADGTGVLSTVPFYVAPGAKNGGNASKPDYSMAYNMTSGTSMASPSIAGAVALMKQYAKNNGLSWSAGEIKSRLMNTAERLFDGWEEEYSVYQIGAGYARVDKAVAETTVASAEGSAWVNEALSKGGYQQKPIQTGSLSFGGLNPYMEGGSATLNKTIKVTLKNYAAAGKTYNITTERQTPPYAEFDASETNPLKNDAANDYGATITYPATAAVGANGTSSFDVTVTLPNLKGWFFYDGYLVLTNAADADDVIRMPYAAALIYDVPMVEEAFWNRPVISTGDNKLNDLSSLSSLWIKTAANSAKYIGFMEVLYFDKDTFDPKNYSIDNAVGMAKGDVAIDLMNDRSNGGWRHTLVNDGYYTVRDDSYNVIDVRKFQPGEYVAVLMCGYLNDFKQNPETGELTPLYAYDRDLVTYFTVDNDAPTLTISGLTDNGNTLLTDNADGSATVSGTVTDAGLTAMKAANVNFDVFADGSKGVADQSFNGLFVSVNGGKAVKVTVAANGAFTYNIPSGTRMPYTAEFFAIDGYAPVMRAESANDIGAWLYENVDEALGMDLSDDFALGKIQKANSLFSSLKTRAAGQFTSNDVIMAGSNLFTKTITVDYALKSVGFTSDDMTMWVGDKFDLTANLNYAAKLGGDAIAAYYADDPTIVAISGGNPTAILTGKNAGTTTVTVVTKQGLKATIDVTVTAKLGNGLGIGANDFVYLGAFKHATGNYWTANPSIYFSDYNISGPLGYGWSYTPGNAYGISASAWNFHPNSSESDNTIVSTYNGINASNDYGTIYETDAKPVLWKIMGEEQRGGNSDGYLSVLSQYVLDTRQFGLGSESLSNYGTENRPTLRYWLNSSADDVFEADWTRYGWVDEDYTQITTRESIPLVGGFTKDFTSDELNVFTATVNELPIAREGAYVTQPVAKVDAPERFYLPWAATFMGNGGNYTADLYWSAGKDLAVGNQMLNHEEAVDDNPNSKATYRNGTAESYWTETIFPNWSPTNAWPYHNYLFVNKNGQVMLNNDSLSQGRSATNYPNGVRPASKLDPTTIAFAYELIGSGSPNPGQLLADGDNYIVPPNVTSKYFKLSVVVDNAAARVGSVSGLNAAYTVQEGSSLDLSSLAPTLNNGAKLAYQLLDGNGNETLMFADDLASLAEIDTSALTVGEYNLKIWAQIAHADSSYEASELAQAKITVVASPVTSITVNPATLTLNVGDSFKLAGDVNADASDRGVYWTSSDNDIAVVNGDGTVIALSAGTVTITATASGDSNFTAACIVTVVKAATGLEFKQGANVVTETDLAVGGTATVTLNVTPSDATHTPTITNSNPSVATYNNGVINALTAGVTAITATVDGVTATLLINVGDTPVVPVTSVTIGAVSDDYEISGSMPALTATVLPADATINGVVWTSSDENVATIAANGAVTAHATGTVTFTAAAIDGSGVTRSVTVEIWRQATALFMVPSSLTINKGQSGVLGYEFYPSDATDKGTVSWGSSAASKATVANGTVTGVSAGNADITVTIGALSATATVTVNAYTEVRITGVNADRQLVFTSEADMTLGATIDGIMSNNINWTSSKPAFASVAADGKVTINAASGSAVIRATDKTTGAYDEITVVNKIPASSIEAFRTVGFRASNNGNESLWDYSAEEKPKDTAYGDLVGKRVPLEFEKERGLYITVGSELAADKSVKVTSSNTRAIVIYAASGANGFTYLFTCGKGAKMGDESTITITAASGYSVSFTVYIAVNVTDILTNPYTGTGGDNSVVLTVAVGETLEVEVTGFYPEGIPDAEKANVNWKWYPRTTVRWYYYKAFSLEVYNEMTSTWEEYDPNPDSNYATYNIKSAKIRLTGVREHDMVDDYSSWNGSGYDQKRDATNLTKSHGLRTLTFNVQVVPGDTRIKAINGGAISETVDYGTLFADAGLPSRLTVTLYDGSEVELPVTWNKPAGYNPSVPGNYDVTGTFDVSETNIGAPVTVTPTATLTVSARRFTAAASVSDVTVAWGTPWAMVDLPKKVNVTTNFNGEVVAAAADWKSDDYTADTAGLYHAVSVIPASFGAVNDSNVKATANVTVKPLSIVSINPVSNVGAGYGSQFENLNLPGFVTVVTDGYGSPTVDVAVTWNGDFDGYKPGAYTLTGTLGGGIANPDGLTAAINVIVAPYIPTVYSTPTPKPEATAAPTTAPSAVPTEAPTPTPANVNNGEWTVDLPDGAVVEALPTKDKLVVDDKVYENFPALNINDYNFIKLRDLAYILNGLSIEFSVDYDKELDAVVIWTHKPYTTADGHEMTTVYTDIKDAKVTRQRVFINGIEVKLTAFNVEGYNYFRLRDLAKYLGFGVEYADNVVTIKSKRK